MNELIVTRLASVNEDHLDGITKNRALLVNYCAILLLYPADMKSMGHSNPWLTGSMVI